MTARTRNRITVRCEFTTDDAPCPVRFSWLGPARDEHTAQETATDGRAACDRAEELGWWFAPTVVACPRHAAKIRPDGGTPDGRA